MKEDELNKVHFEGGEVIFKQGEKGNELYIIQSGNVKITKETDTGELKLATLKKGEIFGEMALFDRLPRSATATALDDTRILCINKKNLFSNISKDPDLVFKILESMCLRIRGLNEELSKLKKNKIEILQLCLDVDDTCSVMLEEAKNIINAENGSIMLLDYKKKVLSIKAAFGSEFEQKVRLKVGEGIAGDVLKTGSAELVNNVTLDSRFKSGALHIKSMLCVPLKWRGYNFGVINMSNSSEELFTLDDLKILHSVAIQASIAIENARNYSDLKFVTDEVIRHATLLNVC